MAYEIKIDIFIDGQALHFQVLQNIFKHTDGSYMYIFLDELTVKHYGTQTNGTQLLF